MRRQKWVEFSKVIRKEATRKTRHRGTSNQEEGRANNRTDEAEAVEDRNHRISEFNMKGKQVFKSIN